MKTYVLALLFMIGLIYILSPGPSSINDFPPIPDSLKSDEPGDTVQVPNVVAYFSEYNRTQITNFYNNEYRKMFFFGKFFPPIKLNYPPQDARKVIRDEQVSTFLEEYLYPLRGSIYVNGYEPAVENEMKSRNRNFIADHLFIKGNSYVSKTTLRFYPADFFERIIVYLGIWVASFGLYETFRKTHVNAKISKLSESSN